MASSWLHNCLRMCYSSQFHSLLRNVLKLRFSDFQGFKLMGKSTRQSNGSKWYLDCNCLEIISQQVKILTVLRADFFYLLLKQFEIEGWKVSCWITNKWWPFRIVVLLVVMHLGQPQVTRSTSRALGSDRVSHNNDVKATGTHWGQTWIDPVKLIEP